MQTFFKPRLYIFVIVIISAFAGLLLGYDAGIIAVSKDQVTKLFLLSDNKWSFIASTSIAGALIGLPISGSLSNRIGRKTMLILVALCFIAGIILTATSSGMKQFILGRFIIGISVGVGSFTAPLFISEIAPSNIRGTLILINGVAITTGQALSFLTGYLLHDISIQSWRYLIWIGMLPASLLFFGMLFVPQSPRWIAMKYGINKARSVLLRLRGHSEKVEQELKEIGATIHKNQHKKFSFPQFFSKHLIGVTAVGLSLGIFQQLVGISALMYYGPVIFYAAGFSPIKHAIFASFSLGIVNLLATIGTMFLVDYFGRRPLLLFGTCMAGVSLILVGFAHLGFIHGKWFIFVFIATYVIGYCMSLGSLFWVIVAEIYPLHIRGKAMSLTSFAETGTSLLVTLTFLQIMHVSGLSGVCWLYGIMCFISFAFIYFYVPETKDVSLERIEANLNRKLPSRYLGQ